MPAGAAILWGSFHIFTHPYTIPNIRKVCMVNETAINSMCTGLFMIISLWNEKIIIKV